MNDEIKCKIFALVATGVDAINYVEEAIFQHKKEKAISMIENLGVLIENIEMTLQLFKIDYSLLYCKNLVCSIQKLAYDKNILVTVFNYEIKPLFFELKKTMEFEMIILADGNSKLKYRNERENIIKGYSKEEKTKSFKFDVSIVLVAYNKLEYTKKAVESIYKYTDFSNGSIELITLNNGSTDGTEEYFNTLPNIKKINLKHNIMGNTIYLHSVEGKYIVGFSNDVVATTNWLENLLKCIKSSDEIFWVVPTCNEQAISNLQGVSVDYENEFSEMNKMQQFAKRYNISNPKKWEERSLLMPFVWIGKSEWVKKGSLLDKLYTQHEFVDDDLSTSLRRAGLKQILAKDTFMHHFGSVSLREGQKESNSLNNMRKVYFDKWGVDAWESRAIFLGLEACLEALPLKRVETALFLEPLFGGSFLQMKNFFRKRGSEINNAEAIVIDERYIDDAKGLFNKVIVDKTIMGALNEIQGSFDIISTGRFLAGLESSDILTLLENLYKKLKKGGIMVLPIQNYRNINVVMQLLLYGSITSYERPFDEFSGCSIDKTRQALDGHPYLCNYDIIMYGNYGSSTTLTEKIIEFINENVGEIHTTDQERFRKELNSIYGFLCIGK